MYDQIIDMLDVAAKSYPIKHLAPKIKNHVSANVAESTLRNELNQQPGYKLGLITALQIIHYTQKIEALDAIEALFGRVAFPLPKRHAGKFASLMRMVATTSREFGEALVILANSLDDGILTDKEREECLAELNDLIPAVMELKAYLNQEVSK